MTIKKTRTRLEAFIKSLCFREKILCEFNVTQVGLSSHKVEKSAKFFNFFFDAMRN